MKVDAQTTVFVTGGDSGIGAGIARAFAAAGAHVVIAGLERESVERAAAAIGGTAAVLDVRDRAGWSAAVEEVWDRRGGIDVLVNNAGVGFLAPATQATFEQWDWVVGINLTGIFNGIKTVVPRMLSRGTPARVVTTASIGGMVGASGAIYAATKFGSVGLMEALHAELWDSPVGVSILVPGIVRTNIGQGLEPPGGRPPASPGGADEHLLYQAPMEPDEVGERVLAGVRADDLYVFTHAEHRSFLEDRFAAILRSLPPETPPPGRAEVERLVLAHPMYTAVRTNIAAADRPAPAG